jgi:hypothetical protein
MCALSYRRHDAVIYPAPLVGVTRLFASGKQGFISDVTLHIVTNSDKLMMFVF